MLDAVEIQGDDLLAMLVDHRVVGAELLDDAVAAAREVLLDDDEAVERPVDAAVQRQPHHQVGPHCSRRVTPQSCTKQLHVSQPGHTPQVTYNR